MTLEEIKQAKETWIKFEDHGDTKKNATLYLLKIHKVYHNILGIIRTKDWKHFEITNNFDLVPIYIRIL
jgi:uncharacterized lipoprotein YehR (DUF1307 family)